MVTSSSTIIGDLDDDGVIAYRVTHQVPSRAPHGTRDRTALLRFVHRECPDLSPCTGNRWYRRPSSVTNPQLRPFSGISRQVKPSFQVPAKASSGIGSHSELGRPFRWPGMPIRCSRFPSGMMRWHMRGRRMLVSRWLGLVLSRALSRWRVPPALLRSPY